jgi:hypothetical protein
MDWNALAEATEERKRIYRRLSRFLEEEEEAPGPVAVKFTWDKFQEFFAIVDGALSQSGPGRRPMLECTDRFFVLLL